MTTRSSSAGFCRTSFVTERTARPVRRAAVSLALLFLGCGREVGVVDGGDVDARPPPAIDAARADTGQLPHVPADCGSLPPAGTWERISPIADSVYWQTPHGFAPQTGSVIVRPDDGAVYVGLTDEGVYRSSDCGASWEKMNVGTHGEEMQSGALWSWLVDPTDPDIMYVVRGYGSGAWMTTDGGTNWWRFVSDDIVGRFVYGALNILAMDPVDPHHLVVGPHNNCSGTPGTCLAETFDAGRVDPTTGAPIMPTWRLFEAPAWSEGGGQVLLTPTRWLYAGVELRTSGDGGATWERSTVPAGNSYFSPDVYRGPAGDYLLGFQYGVVHSADGVTWEAMGAGTPTGRIITFASGGGDVFAGSPTQRTLWRSSPEALDRWTEIPLPEEPSGGDAIIFLAYDADNHVVYASRWGNGLWRYIVE